MKTKELISPKESIINRANKTNELFKNKKLKNNRHLSET